MKNSSLITLLITQGVGVFTALIVSFGVAITAVQMAAIMGVAGFVGLVLTFVLWARTVPAKDVLEKLVGDQVVAGEANDIVPNGVEIRELGGSFEDAEPRRALEE